VLLLVLLVLLFVLLLFVLLVEEGMNECGGEWELNNPPKIVKFISCHFILSLSLSLA
jgi:hypothetical protein